MRTRTETGRVVSLGFRAGASARANNCARTLFLHGTPVRTAGDPFLGPTFWNYVFDYLLFRVTAFSLCQE